MRLRALRSSKDFDEYWKFHESCEYKRNHQDLYENGIVPATNASESHDKRKNFKIIK